jgi:hypothetical protein
MRLRAIVFLAAITVVPRGLASAKAKNPRRALKECGTFSEAGMR